MRWPWSRRETRSAGGGYSDAVVAAVEAQAAAKVADTSSTAAIEAAAGALSRAFASAEVQGPGWARDAVTPPWLAQVGRSLVREGASLSVVGMRGGAVTLTPAAFYNFEKGSPNDEHEEDWLCRATTYGPGSSTTRLLSRDRIVYTRWGTSPGTRYRGQGPMSWASLTAKLQGEAERSLGDELGGPVAQLLAIPQDGGDGKDGVDPLAPLKKDIATARGKALFVETTSAGWGEGRQAAPGNGNRDWVASRLGPSPPDGSASVAGSAFCRLLAACGAPPALFESNADGTSQREAVRRWHQNTVLPLARILEHELTLRLEADVRLKFDPYPLDVQGRSASFAKLVQGGVSVEQALIASGLLQVDE